VNPFQTVEREQVGLTLKITPQINEGNAVRLQISQEVSSVSESTQAVDLITNNRTITTSVIVDDRGILVLGGLIQEELREKEQRVPLLGSIPLIGALFRSTSVQKVKTNLMFFIRPTILRDGTQAAFETGAKYNYIRDLQLRDEPDLVLPAWQEQRSTPFAMPDLMPQEGSVIDLREQDSDDSTEE
jgi:general secretion pathway protein D